MEQITIFTRADFRKWLAKHHAKERRVAVILYKRHTGKPAPSHRALMEEAICFGWIDTTVKRLDEDTYIRHFCRRNNNSKWSENTLRYAKQLIKEKKMMSAGLHFYKLGLQRPTHDVGIPKNPSMPTALKKALAKSKTTGKSFAIFPPSTKKMLYKWFLSAKLPATKKKRIAAILRMARKGKVSFSKDGS